MKIEKIEAAPIGELLIIFTTYGFLLIIILSVLFWEWSNLAFLGFFCLITFGSLLMGTIVYSLRKTRRNSKYHNWAYLSAILFFAITPLAFTLLIIAEKIKQSL